MRDENTSAETKFVATIHTRVSYKVIDHVDERNVRENTVHRLDLFIVVFVSILHSEIARNSYGSAVTIRTETIKIRVNNIIHAFNIFLPIYRARCISVRLPRSNGLLLFPHRHHRPDRNSFGSRV